MTLLTSACASAGSYVWISEYTAPPTDREAYAIRPGDVIEVRVFNQQQMSGRARVRTDGRVTLPFLNDVDAAGYSPEVLAQQLQTRLKEFINAPIVTVSVEESKAVAVSVVGRVPRPGQYSLDSGITLLQILTQAGGLDEFAHRDRIFVLRDQPRRVRIRFRYTDLLHGEPKASRFTLRVGDVVVVE